MSIFFKRNTIVCVLLAFFVSAGTKLYALDVVKSIEVTNNSPEDIKDYIVELAIEKLNLSYGDYHVKEDGMLISPLEIITEIDGSQHALFCIPFLKSNERKKLVIAKGNIVSYPKRTSAELTHKIGGQFIGKEYIGSYSWVKTNKITLPAHFRDHSYYIKYEGPGWESDKIAYRFYLDNRNAIDVFAKHTTNLVLAGVGVDGFDNYHNLAAWGMDNLKVGKSLGLGSIAAWSGTEAVRVEKRDSTTCIIAADGKLRSQVKTKYYNWKNPTETTDLVSLISIDAGSSKSHIQLQMEKSNQALATGIIKQKEAKLLVSNNPLDEWSYIATFGKQSLNKDMQGLVIFARTQDIKEITEDALNHIIVFNRSNNVEYHIMATWELDTEPVKTEKEFLVSIEKELVKLNKNNITIEIN